MHSQQLSWTRNISNQQPSDGFVEYKTIPHALKKLTVWWKLNEFLNKIYSSFLINYPLATFHVAFGQ